MLCTTTTTTIIIIATATTTTTALECSDYGSHRLFYAVLSP
jgi:hypothetical protein